MYKISDILEYDINVQELYNKIKSFIAHSTDNFNSSLEQEENSNNEITKSNEEGINQEQTEQIQNESEQIVTEEVQNMQQDENKELTQMEIDAQFIKSNYSLIKPLEGEITSRFGYRNPSSPNVPTYHTGIDIARDIGTVIIASMDGDVELVSEKGDYGNHLKITKGEVSTVYAHCSKIYVKEGEHIVQGQKIAEVGDTGNVTGPHLHFEILRNNERVNPDLVLQF